MASPTRPIRSGKTTTAVQLLLLALMEVGIFIGVVHSCISGEQEALMKFKQGLEDPHNRLGSWIAGTNCCSWKGIGCDGRTGQVIVLDLRSESLRGEIDPSLCYLKQIQYLDMSWNNFSVNNLNFIDCFQELRYLNLSASIRFGTLPQQLGNLSKLHTLDLSQNSALILHDVAWLGFLSSLHFIDLSGLDLSNSTNWIQSLNKLPYISVISCKFCSIGSLPKSLPHVNFTSLITLDLSGNCLESELPGWLFMIRNIEHLFLSRINCNGHVFPLAVGNLKKLKVLELSRNNYEGSIPQSIGALSSLEQLDLSSNDFSGSISDNFFEKMLSLQEVDISYNNFGGSIPTSLGKSSSLRLLSLKTNNFNGSISDDYFEEMKSLTKLDMSGNYLSGSLPTSLGKLLALQTLSLRLNNFIGLLPASLGNLHLLELLDLSSNDFSGIIPDFLGNLQLLRGLDLSDNSLSGLIPTSIWKLRSLEELGLSGNKFKGNIPESVCELSSLEEFDVSENEKMNGTLPHCIGQLGELWRLHIGGENFEIALNESHFANMTNLKILEIGSAKPLVMNFSSDWVPPFRLDRLYIYSAEIGSEFPMWIRTQKTLSILMLSNTSIYGNLPTWIWDFSDTLEYIDLSNNNMSGELPHPKHPILLEDLDLSSNKFRDKYLGVDLRNSCSWVFFDSCFCWI